MTGNQLPVMDQARPVTCQKCAACLGYVISVGESELFLIPGYSYMREISGHCFRCGRIWYWSVTANKLEQVLNQLLKLHVE